MKSLSPRTLLRRLSPPSSTLSHSPIAQHARSLSHLAHSTPALPHTHSFTPLTTPHDHSPHMLYSNHQPVAPYVSQTCASSESNNVCTVRSYLRALEQGNSRELACYYADTFQQIESPTSSFSSLLSTPGTFSHQRLIVKNIAELNESQVIVDVQWSGTLARPVERCLKAGDELSGRTLVWFHLQAGQITRQANFHCVNPSF